MVKITMKNGTSYILAENLIEVTTKLCDNTKKYIPFVEYLAEHEHSVRVFCADYIESFIEYKMPKHEFE